MSRCHNFILHLILLELIHKKGTKQYKKYPLSPAESQKAPIRKTLHHGIARLPLMHQWRGQSSSNLRTDQPRLEEFEAYKKSHPLKMNDIITQFQYGLLPTVAILFTTGSEISLGIQWVHVVALQKAGTWINLGSTDFPKGQMDFLPIQRLRVIPLLMCFTNQMIFIESTHAESRATHDSSSPQRTTLLDNTPCFGWTHSTLFPKNCVFSHDNCNVQRMSCQTIPNWNDRFCFWVEAEVCGKKFWTCGVYTYIYT